MPAPTSASGFTLVELVVIFLALLAPAFHKAIHACRLSRGPLSVRKDTAMGMW